MNVRNVCALAGFRQLQDTVETRENGDLRNLQEEEEEDGQTRAFIVDASYKIGDDLVRHFLKNHTGWDDSEQTMSAS
eukprot:365270-Chlamydomonas_euryale.AAC.23